MFEHFHTALFISSFSGIYIYIYIEREREISLGITFSESLMRKIFHRVPAYGRFSTVPNFFHFRIINSMLLTDTSNILAMARNDQTFRG